MPHRSMQRTVATTLVGTVLILCSGLPAAAAAASLEGRVLAGTDGGARSGVVVMLVDEVTKATYRSPSTNDSGAFRIEGAAPGTYRVLVDAPEGTFLAAQDVSVRPGANRPVSLTLKGKQGAPPPTAPAPAPAPPAPSAGGLQTWEKWLIAGGIAVGALLVVNEVTEDEKSASAF
jgi:carboxypeptidase family protein